MKGVARSDLPFAALEPAVTLFFFFGAAAAATAGPAMPVMAPGAPPPAADVGNPTMGPEGVAAVWRGDVLHGHVDGLTDLEVRIV